LGHQWKRVSRAGEVGLRLEGSAADELGVFQLLDRVEMSVDQRGIGQRPQVLGWLQFRGIGGRPYDAAKRSVGLDWPRKAHTMFGTKRLDNV
jgi:macrocin-O-methyltransferase TylF-like protien